MSKPTLILVVCAWIVWVIVQYYFLPLFFLVPLWLLLSLALLLFCLTEIKKLIRERRQPGRFRICKVVISFLLFFFTFRSAYVNRVMEKIDWKVFYNRRADIIRQVREGKLNPNVDWNQETCQLPYAFPVVSNGGNDIAIVRDTQSKSVTVTFYIIRNYFDAPSTMFIYTDENKETAMLDNLVKNDPENNQKLQNHWYRTYNW